MSVVLPAFNEEGYIRRSVDSILSQTFPDFELILLDDGSTDDTWKIMQSYQDSRIRMIQLGRVGFTKALNYGLRISRGDYIARMDADDESLPKRLERQVEFLDSQPTVSIVGTTYYRHDGLRNERYVRCFPQHDQDIRRALGLYIPICHGSVMFRKVVIEKVGGYNESLSDLEDLELWLRAAPHFRFANLGPPPLHVYWFDPKHSYFQSMHGSYRRVRQSIRLNGRAIRQLNLPKHYYALLGAKVLYYALLPNRLKRMARRLVAGATESPWPGTGLAAELPAHENAHE
ncbi:MAG: hypothetical protein A2Z21_07745 [Candidatus Fraserbacteria bacterium RBG_16_55_9]|uniref:Glycosyltransferase 2-like domain-containing protein n=1 Tax=Fraserbacteria sp. (strain RBG_16_55_9) TaxID=1817864 RepID=A0A1F5UW06_FRAXR|nr:MAG: hypothetical protein A2Z21_07745 [Candidatus Fraserbacteria bacterium RBG_16_55_9]